MKETNTSIMLDKIKLNLINYFRLFRLGYKLKNKSIVKVFKTKVKVTHEDHIAGLRLYKKSTRKLFSRWRKYFWKPSKTSQALYEDALFLKEASIEAKKDLIYFQEHFMRSAIKRKAIHTYNKLPYQLLYTSAYSFFLYHFIPKFLTPTYTMQEISTEFIAITFLFLLLILPLNRQ